MEFHFNGSNPADFDELKKLEWLETNGMGGWASGTVSGAHTRRYHGMLVAATRPPVGRMVLLSKLDESIQVGRKKWELSSNQYPGTVHPDGFQHLVKFEKDLFPEFYYQINDIRIRKTIVAVQSQNTTLVFYEVLKASQPVTLSLRPFMAFRDYHSLTRNNPAAHTDCTFEDHTLISQMYDGSPTLFIKIPGAKFTKETQWYYNFEYYIERERGLDFQEDLLTPGQFTVMLRPGDKLGCIISTENPGGQDAWNLYRMERERREKLIDSGKSKDKFYRQLLLAADQFIVHREGGLKSIIAGYHWFSDWGRDTMIALPGICLTTGRFQDAQEILRAFAKHAYQGLLPNRFMDAGEEPEYNTVDASLWFFISVYRYYQMTLDIESIQRYFWPVFKDMISWFDKGTNYQIHTDRDHLLYAGVPGVQLTWMDAKVGNWVVTPRVGKPVEINALWYNVVRIYAFFARLLDEPIVAREFEQRARRIKQNYQEVFWNADLGVLYDVVNEDRKDDSIRPNQIFSLCLPYTLFEGARARSILDVVTSKLYTPMGLRSLAPGHADYRGYYQGGPLERDGAYHQGTVWSWLLGPYIDTLVKIHGEKGLREAKKVINNLKPHLAQAGVGSISEIFDAEAPHQPRGCIAQAWSVGELLRVYNDYMLAIGIGKTKSVQPVLT